MYKLLLILKYLRRKLAPLFAAVAVMLCTAMVIIVMSVMGGFLDQFRESARNLTGDVIVEGSLQGFEQYEELLAAILELPEIQNGTPLIETYGLINFRDNAKPVRVQGVDMAKLEEIVGYKHTLMWTPDELLELPKEILGEDSKRYQQIKEQITREHPIDPGRDEEGQRQGLPEALIGIEVNPYHYRDELGNYNIDSTWARAPMALTVVPLTSGGTASLEQERREFVVVNEFKSGLFDIDGQYVFVPFDTLQKMLAMDQRKGFDTEGFDPETGLGGKEIVIPGRANRLVLKVAPGVEVLDARNRVQKTIADFYDAQDNLLLARPRALTWEDVHGQIIGAVKNEKNLVSFLFGVISLVAIFMVATTFYTLIQDKTRDIGILRAIGATRKGILGLFVGYGLAIGVIGAVGGAALGVGVVRALNLVQHFLGHYLGVTSLLIGSAVLGAVLGLILAILIGFRQRRMVFWIKRIPALGALLLFLPSLVVVLSMSQVYAWLNENIRFVMWDPQTYFFDRIPDRIDPLEITLVSVGMIVSCVIGSLIPALIASSLEPVETLRYE
ncbi:ABC transporter permease [Algisphaera agarilytica]|uniref:Lipoprotein-releasing system permease protein n=1 Tax=Algisphaera agarilytica TaxID=1385975 RepID=A0A7X0H6Q4_9BACT|nr:FtsX-like permease family protein [Algisphaera agarilytica]MBB6430280.1 lipoprotein-releasing system permease protein [Algisphaera agarilytica]